MVNETLIRLSAFIGLFFLFALLEAFFPRRTRRQSQSKRWLTNWAISILDNVTLRLFSLLVPLLAIGAALDATALGVGVLNKVALPTVLEIALAILVLDFAIWAQHLITHKVPLFWRFHRVHHSDRDIDVTTAIRFHPIEIAFSMGLKILLVYLLGPSAVAVILFEVLLNGTAMFNHANIRLPLWLDTWVRLVLVTPDMHRVHHSIHRQEHDSNYGFALSIWDRMFGTYIAQPALGHDDMTIGLQWQDDAPARLGWSLWLPFQKK